MGVGVSMEARKGHQIVEVGVNQDLHSWAQGGSRHGEVHPRCLPRQSQKQQGFYLLFFCVH